MLLKIYSNLLLILHYRHNHVNACSSTPVCWKDKKIQNYMLHNPELKKFTQFCFNKTFQQQELFNSQLQSISEIFKNTVLFGSS